MTEEAKLLLERDTEIVKAALEDVHYGLLVTYDPRGVIANARMPGGHEFFQSKILDSGEQMTIKFSIEITGAQKP